MTIRTLSNKLSIKNQKIVNEIYKVANHLSDSVNLILKIIDDQQAIIDQLLIRIENLEHELKQSNSEENNNV